MKLTDVDEELQKYAMFFGFSSLDADGFAQYERCDRHGIVGFSITRTRMCELGRTDANTDINEFYVLSKMTDYIVSDYAAKSFEKVIIVGSRMKPNVSTEHEDNWNVHLYWQGYRFFGHFRNNDERFYIWFPSTPEWIQMAMWLKMMIGG